MIAEDESPAEAVTGLTDQFVQAGAAKLDALFGAGYAKANPAALAAYVAACASNFNTVLNAAMAAHEDESFEEALATFETKTSGHHTLEYKKDSANAPYSYLQNPRIEPAMPLLRVCEHTVTHVCYDVACPSQRTITTR